MFRKILFFSLIFISLSLSWQGIYAQVENWGIEKYEGIGIIPITKGNYLVVGFVIDDSPAQNLGIKPGDIILRVDGYPVWADDINRVETLIRGPVGIEVRLTIQREGEKDPIELLVPRAVIDMRALLARRIRRVYRDTVILTQAITGEITGAKWNRHVVNLFLNVGDLVFYRFVVEQGSFVRRSINFYIMNKYNYLLWENSSDQRFWKSLTSSSGIYNVKRDIVNINTYFIAPLSGSYYFVFYNPSDFYNKKVFIEMELVRAIEDVPTTPILTFNKVSRYISLPNSLSQSISIKGRDFLRYSYELDADFEFEFSINAKKPVNFYIMGSYDFSEWIKNRSIKEVKPIAYKEYKFITQLHDIFIVPIRDKYYFVFENTDTDSTSIDFKFSFSK